MCMIDFGCYTNHSLGMNTAEDYNNAFYYKGRYQQFVTDRYSVAVFKELDELDRKTRNNLRCGLEIDTLRNGRNIPVKCIAVSNKGIENLHRIVEKAGGQALSIEELADMKEGVLFGFSEGYEDNTICEAADFWYLTPAFTRDECRSLYAAAKKSNKFLCAATNGCYVNKDDRARCNKSNDRWTHFMSESEMFDFLDFFGHQIAWEILIDNPFKLLDPYDDFLNSSDICYMPECI